MRRGAATVLLCFASLLACVALPALWVRSYFVHDSLDWDTRGGRTGLLSAHGRLSIGHVVVPAAALAQVHFGIRYGADRSGVTELNPSWSSWTGVQVTYVAHSGFTASDVRVPYWMLFVVALPCAVWAHRRLRRPPPGCCPACGYDLRATPERCPECGRPSPNVRPVHPNA